MPPTKTWKTKEREFAAFFGTVRRPLSGGNSSQGTRRDDAQHLHLFLECKYSLRSVVWKLWRFAKSCCQRELRHPKRTPVLGIYTKGESGCLLVMHESDLFRIAEHRLHTLCTVHAYQDFPEIYDAVRALKRINHHGS